MQDGDDFPVYQPARRPMARAWTCEPERRVTTWIDEAPLPSPAETEPRALPSFIPPRVSVEYAPPRNLPNDHPSAIRIWAP